MKLLIVGHTYITAFAQQKYVAMKELAPDLQLRLVVPPDKDDVLMSYQLERHPRLEPQEIVPLPVLFPQSHMTYIHPPHRLAAVLKTFYPDHIHIEEDPHSLVGIETVFLTRLVCRQATVSFFIWDNLAHSPRFPLDLAKRVFTRYAFTRSDLVVCGNREGQVLLRKVKAYVAPSLVLPQLGLDPDEYKGPLAPRLCQLLPRASDTPLLGFLGRFVPEKGVRLLLDALSQLQTKKWKLVLVGNGVLKEEIRTHWQTVLGERLICLDSVPPQDVSQYMRYLDIFVLPSYGTPVWKEQFGLALAQAMMAGVACIGSSSGAIPDVLGPGGLIFQEQDRDDLVRTLEALLDSPQLRYELGQKARTFALQHYTNRHVASSYLAAFSELRSADMTTPVSEH